MRYGLLFLIMVAMVMGAMQGMALEAEQISFSTHNHDLDNNDNISPDGRFIVYDTRETVGPGIDHGQSIEVIDLATKREFEVYRPEMIVMGSRPAPGVGAVSFSGASNEVAFIHGPPVEELDLRGPYGKPNRCGGHLNISATVRSVNGKYAMDWLDKRDIATNRDTIPGAHRGGTHRHEYTLDGKRIGFTYDDFLLPQYGRSVGYMEANPKAPEGVSHYFAMLVQVVPEADAKPGDLVKAQGDSWVGREGLMRGFIGTIVEADGSQQDSLFMIDIPADVDITTADSGSATRYPTPPEGVSIRRLTHSFAKGTLRGTPEGDRLAYYGLDADGVSQIFIIAPDGSDKSNDPAKRPVQATKVPEGAEHSLRWHPSGNSIFYVSNGAVVTTCVKPGPRFGETKFLTEQADGPERKNIVVAPDGTFLAFNRLVPTPDETGKIAKSYNGSDFMQIFIMSLPDDDGDGVVDVL